MGRRIRIVDGWNVRMGVHSKDGKVHVKMAMRGVSAYKDLKKLQLLLETGGDIRYVIP